MESAETKAAASASDEAFAPALTREFKTRLRPCLNALDALRSQGLQREISLPAIAVVGDQSVGKSSVLEAISGVEFPRGTGIVTRCPLMLQMRSREDEAWLGSIRYESKAGEQVEKKLSSPKEIGDAIREAQNAMTSSSGEISSNLIEMRVEGTDTPDLTLIDLPGIARYSAELGGTVANITKSLIVSFIEKPEVIILVVIPCHIDIETVEALSLAKEVDPDSSRTIGVLTCPDLVNPGSEPEVLAMMQNQKIRLQKGFVTVRCRTPRQLKDGVTLRQACREEEEFFVGHRFFAALDPYERGSRTLAVKLSCELFNIIKSNVPEMLKEIQVKREEYTRQLQLLGSGPPEEDEDMKRQLVKMFTKFTKEFASVATGTHRHEPDRLYGRCRKHWEEVANCIEDCAFSEKREAKELWRETRKSIEEQRGCELPGFDNVFPVLQRIVVQRFVDSVAAPCSGFLVAINQEVDETIRSLADQTFADYPALNQHVKETCEGIRSRLVTKAREEISNIFEQEKYVFTQDRTFNREREMQRADGQQSTKAEAADPRTEAVLSGVSTYVRVAVRRLQDLIVMAVIRHLLYGMADAVTEELMLMITESQDLFKKLQEENPEVSSKRRHLRERLQHLTMAEQELVKF